MVMSQINMTSIGSLILFLVLTIIHAQNECSGGSANCVNIRNCPQIISILTDPTPPSAEMLQTLDNAQCGFESNNPKYCCNQITTTTTTTVKPDIETPYLPDVTNHPNLRLLDHQACGPVPEHRPNGGNETEIFQYPWMSLILYDIGRPSLVYMCSGTIISSRYVLTAAICVKSPPPDIVFRVISVRVGDHDVSKKRECITNNRGLEIVCAERYQDFGVDSLHPHPRYTRNNISDMLKNDIGLIRLNGSIDFTPRNVKPICLPFGSAAIITRKRAVVTGWEISERDPENPGKLLQMKISLITNEWCNKMFNESEILNERKKIGLIQEVTYEHLCSYGQENEKPDMMAGIPLLTIGIYNGGSARIIQHGIYDNAPQYPYRDVLIIYTKVSYFMDWILDTMTD